jgi:hypothetical protein
MNYTVSMSKEGGKNKIQKNQTQKQGIIITAAQTTAAAPTTKTTAMTTTMMIMMMMITTIIQCYPSAMNHENI